MRINRSEQKAQMRIFLRHFEANKNDLSIIRGMYVRGNVGVGKTELVKETLAEEGYAATIYDSSVLRNKALFYSISKNNMASTNVLSQFRQERRPTAIVIDDIDGMISGDKGGLTALIKLIQPKKTKRQKADAITYNPIICISNRAIDKKISELIRMCEVLDVPDPTGEEMRSLLPAKFSSKVESAIFSYVKKDLRKLAIVCNIWNIDQARDVEVEEGEEVIIAHLQTIVKHTHSNKGVAQRLLSIPFTMEEMSSEVPETSKTTVGLLMHENAVDLAGTLSPNEGRALYLKFLNNFCYGDYIDRVTFQKQIWKFNDLSVIIKVYANAHLMHTTFQSQNLMIPTIPEVRFTKVLTKHSTEYGNEQFLHSMAFQLNWDLEDVISYFMWLRNQDATMVAEITARLDLNEEVKAPMVKRMMCFLDMMTQSEEDAAAVMTKKKSVSAIHFLTVKAIESDSGDEGVEEDLDDMDIEMGEDMNEEELEEEEEDDI